MTLVYDASAHESEGKVEKKAKKVARKHPVKRDPRKYSSVMREMRSTTNPLSAFCVRPDGVRLAIQEDEEEILLLMRRHFITNVGWILVAMVLFLAPLLLSHFPALMVLPVRFQFMTGVLWYLLAIGFVVEQFLSWYFNVYVVTDERIIDVDFLNLIYKNISAAKLDRIEDVTVREGGAIRNFLNFGTIYIQTAGEVPEIEFEDVPYPQKVAKFINEMMLEEEQEQLDGRAK